MTDHAELIERLRARVNFFNRQGSYSPGYIGYYGTPEAMAMSEAADAIAALVLERDALAAEVARLREALKPFAETAGNYHYEDPQHHGVVFISDLRRARAALAQEPTS